MVENKDILPDSFDRSRSVDALVLVGLDQYLLVGKIKSDALAGLARSIVTKSVCGKILAKYYIDYLKVEIKKGVTARLQDGHWSFKAPLGYLNYRCPEARQSIIIKDSNLGPAIAEIFQKYATGNYPMPELIGILNRASKKVHRWRILAPMLRNPFYIGAMQVKDPLMQGKHEPLVSKKLLMLVKRLE